MARVFSIERSAAEVTSFKLCRVMDIICAASERDFDFTMWDMIRNVYCQLRHIKKCTFPRPSFSAIIDKCSVLSMIGIAFSSSAADN